MAKVSVIIPVYNRAHLLRESINSVLDQDYQDIEVVVVDDGSVEPIKDVVRQYDDRVRYIRQENSGASTARNTGVLYSTGDYLMFLDSDDILLPNALERLAGALDSSPEYGAAYCGWIETDGPGHVIFRSELNSPTGNIFVDVCTRWLCIVHSVMVRRQCIAKSGLFDTDLTMYEDWNFNIRLAAHWQFVYVPEHLVEYRTWHSSSSTIKKNLSRQKRIYLKKLSVFRILGRLDRRTWALARHRLYPDLRLRDAYRNYSAGSYMAACRLTLAAGIRRPYYAFSRSWWGLLARSLRKCTKSGTNEY